MSTRLVTYRDLESFGAEEEICAGRNTPIQNRYGIGGEERCHLRIDFS
jgi:hypothetical protein